MLKPHSISKLVKQNKTNTLDTVEDTLYSTRSLDSTESDDFVNKIEIGSHPMMTLRKR